jgi:hypothetical protein
MLVDEDIAIIIVNFSGLLMWIACTLREIFSEV